MLREGAGLVSSGVDTYTVGGDEEGDEPFCVLCGSESRVSWEGTEGLRHDVATSCLAGAMGTGVPSDVPPLITVVNPGVAGVLDGGAVPLRQLPEAELPVPGIVDSTGPVALKAAAFGLRTDTDLALAKRPSTAAVIGGSASNPDSERLGGRELGAKVAV